MYITIQNVYKVANIAKYIIYKVNYMYRYVYYLKKLCIQIKSGITIATSISKIISIPFPPRFEPYILPFLQLVHP